MNEISVKAENLSKRFNIYQKPYDRLLEWATFGQKSRHKEFWALQNVSFELNKGESLGIIGPNGAGKSTLLKILTGSLLPTTGGFQINGRVVSLLELGTGFHPELTGIQNIYNSTSLLGFDHAYIKSKINDIIDFSGIGHFLEHPVKTYSSGMYVRLAFSLFANLEPDIYIVDEALAVGDVFFQQKCYAKLEEMKANGVTIILVTHDSAPIINFCDYAMIIEEGKITESGEPSKIVDLYQASEYAKKNSQNEYIVHIDDGRLKYGNNLCEIERVSLQVKNEEKDFFRVGENIDIHVDVKCSELLKDDDQLNIGIQIKNRLGSVVYGTNTYWNKINLTPIPTSEALRCTFSTCLNLGPGDYTLTVAVSEAKRHVEKVFCWIENVAKFTISEEPEPTFGGQVFLPMDIKVTRSK